MKKKFNICHLTSAHSREDIRIFVKQCRSLAIQENFKVSLVVADGFGDDVVDGINIYDVGKLEGRLNRFITTSKNVYKKAISLDNDIYQLHDPELIPFGLRLKRAGKKVVFDAHEDLPQQLRSKPYLNRILKWILPMFFEKYEKYAFSRFDALLGATPFIAKKLKKINVNTVNINNYPIIGELDENVNWNAKSNEISYIGAVSRIRGIVEIIEAMQYVRSNVRLNIAGVFNESNLLDEVKNIKGWAKVNYFGLVDRKEVSKILSRSKIGIVTFLSAPNHVNSQPNKMFEYMSSGVPIITSNFELWKDVVELNDSGITVDPSQPKIIAEAIDKLIENGDIAEQMGINGKEAVLNKFNWEIEEEKLVKLYLDLR